MATDTAKYKFDHSMLRVKDPKVSMKYYEFLGMKQIHKISYPEYQFDLYCLAYDSPESASSHWSDRQGVLQLLHKHGSESDDRFKISNGNSDPGKGFGHVCISVDNIQAACQRIEDAGYRFKKKLSDGRMRDIAFALDPDDYWVEIIGQKSVEKTEGVTETDPGAYLFNHTMIRVKDPTASLKFYQETMGMTLLRTLEMASSGFNLYFLGYPPESAPPSAGGDYSTSVYEGLLELTWNYGTESDPNFSYHNGNADPQGFGHIGVSVDDVDAACTRFEEKGVRWQKRLTEDRVAFMLDPDGYWIQITQNQKLNKSSDS